MSCYACADVIDCVEFGGIISDVSPSNGFYATQDYTFLIDCPSGYICFPGIFPIVITIHKGEIPGVTIGQGGNMSIRGCLSLLSVNIPIGSSPFQVQVLANSLFQQWAFQEAKCRSKQTIPAPIFVGGRHVRTDLTNEERCFTAHCVPENAGPPSQQCVEPGQHNLTLFDASPDQIAGAQAQLNANALKEATDSATGLLACGVCNAQVHAFAVCPTNPLLIASVTIPPNAFCLPVPASQFQVDSLANIASINQTTALLAGLGCVCPGAVIGGGVNDHNLTIAAPCGVVTATWNLNSPTGPFAISPTFNPEVQWCNFNAAGYPCTHPELHSDLFSSIFPNFHLFQYIAAHP